VTEHELEEAWKAFEEARKTKRTGWISWERRQSEGEVRKGGARGEQTVPL
jgi:hypothetical protein